MKVIINIILSWLALMNLSLAVAQSSEQLITSPGTHELVFKETGNRYTLVIPEGYTGEEPVPFVLSLHFGGAVTPFYGRSLVDELIAPALEGLGAIIVAPDNIDGGWANEMAEQHVLNIVDYVQANLNTDRERTALVGVSMGGAGTWYFAPRYPERFKVAIPISGRPQEDTLDFAWETPLYIIHSADDEVVDIEPTEEAVATLQALGKPLTFVKVNGPSHFEFSRLRPHLEGAVPWILEKWAD